MLKSCKNYSCLSKGASMYNSTKVVYCKDEKAFQDQNINRDSMITFL